MSIYDTLTANEYAERFSYGKYAVAAGACTSFQLPKKVSQDCDSPLARWQALALKRMLRYKPKLTDKIDGSPWTHSIGGP